MSLLRTCAVVASNSSQATQLRDRIDKRIEAGLYPREIEFEVLCDPAGGRVGSGGAAILAACKFRDSLLGDGPILVINAGGESRRMPAYAPEGKLFAPLPLPSSSRVPPVILDEQLGLFLRYPWKDDEFVVTSGDVVISFDADVLPPDRGDIYGFAKPDTFDLGSRHGVFKFDRNRAKVIDFFQKGSIDFLREQAPLEGSRSCALDMGIVGFSSAGVARLFALADTVLPGGGSFLDLLKKGQVEVDLYGELLMAFVSGISFDSYFEKVRSLTSLEPSLLKVIYKAFRTVDFRAFLTRHARFLHFGSLSEYPSSCEEIVTSGALPFYVGDDAELRPMLSDSLIQFNSLDCVCVPAPGARHIYLECCARTRLDCVEGENLLIGLRNRHFESPIACGICLDERFTSAGRFLLAYGIRDTWRPQKGAGEIVFCGKSLASWAVERGLGVEALFAPFIGGDEQVYDLWDALLFVPDADERFTEGYWRAEHADTNWRARFLGARRFSIRQIAASENPAERDENRAQIRQELLASAIVRGHGWLSVSEWDFRKALAGSDLQNLRDIYDSSDDDLVKIYRRKLMESLTTHPPASDSIVGLDVQYLDGGTSARGLRRAVKLDQIVWARSPVRLDLAGGWTDTPPFTLREGGEVVNVAVDLNDQPPIQVFCRPTTEHTVRIRSIDLGVGETIRSFAALEDYNRPGSPFALPKAALCLLGFRTERAEKQPLGKILETIGCGMEITLLSAVPKGSGLGTSSILAATILGALERFFGLAVGRDELFRQVLQTEQMLTTGGGWQDQIGGVVGGVKYISAMPGLRPNPMVYQLDPHVFLASESNALFSLYYTGITRLAKNILQEVVDRVNSMEPAYLFSLRYLKQLARSMREAVSQRDLAALGRLLSASWEENKLIHPSTSNEEVQRLLRNVHGLYSGMKLLGAGGGGFALFLSDSIEQANRLRDRLSAIEDERARLVDMKLNERGLQITVS